MSSMNGKLKLQNTSSGYNAPKVDERSSCCQLSFGLRAPGEHHQGQLESTIYAAPRLPPVAAKASIALAPSRLDLRAAFTIVSSYLCSSFSALVSLLL